MKLNKKPIIFLLGPTASGKTDWAIDWQNKFDVLEIISVDSVMVYKECNVGSAKPSNETLKHHPHHLVNHVSLDSIFSVANFYDAALELIDAIHNAPNQNIEFILINPAAYTHTSIALRDALLGIGIPFYEIHISDISAREDFRHRSYFSDIAEKVFSGMGIEGYEKALIDVIKNFKGS